MPPYVLAARSATERPTGGRGAAPSTATSHCSGSRATGRRRVASMAIVVRCASTTETVVGKPTPEEGAVTCGQPPASALHQACASTMEVLWSGAAGKARAVDAVVAAARCVWLTQRRGSRLLAVGRRGGRPPATGRRGGHPPAIGRRDDCPSCHRETKRKGHRRVLLWRSYQRPLP